MDDATQLSVQVEHHESIRLLRICHPPVNAVSARVRLELFCAIEEADIDPHCHFIVIVGAGRNFMAGADIHEFDSKAQPPALTEVCNRIESCRKPVLAVIQGAALGGGLEVALSCHYRIASEGARLGLPEVLLGLMPGAGGTQRLPRLIGVGPALSLMLSGRHVAGKEAFALGIVDGMIAGEDTEAEGIQFARELLTSGRGVRRTRDARALGDVGEARAEIASARVELAGRFKNLYSPGRIVDSVERILDGSFDEGLAGERAAYLSCQQSQQRPALVHAFLAEREVAKAPESLIAQPLSVSVLGVVGGGTMGAGIAVAAIQAGLCVRMVEQDPPAVERGRANVERVFAGQVSRGRLSQVAMNAALDRFSVSTDYRSLADVDVAVEAVFEDMSIKKAVFGRLNEACKPEAVLATNTSYLDIDEIAQTVPRSGRVVGLHFFSPANIMPLLEIVVARNTDARSVATAFALAKKLGKVPVRAGVCDGFIGNRMLAVYRTAADHMMEDGASPYQIDSALREFGFAMGPYQVSDLAGGDIGWATRKRRGLTRDPGERYVQIPDRLCERGWFGQKTDRGYYVYADGSRIGREDPEVLALVDQERCRAGVTPRRFTDDEIVRRYLAAMINEGATVVQDRIALRPLDVDVTLLHGYGFPRFRGGPMKYADTVGLPTVLADIAEFAGKDPRFWRPSDLLVGLVRQGADFSTLNTDQP